MRWTGSNLSRLAPKPVTENDGERARIAPRTPTVPAAIPRVGYQGQKGESAGAIHAAPPKAPACRGRTGCWRVAESHGVTSASVHAARGSVYGESRCRDTWLGGETPDGTSDQVPGIDGDRDQRRGPQ